MTTEKAQARESAVNQTLANLFTNGIGDQAQRLALILPDGRNVGGWGRAPVKDKLAALFDAGAVWQAKQGQSDREKRLEEALREAVAAIRTLPQDALGMGKMDDRCWPLRDELLAQCKAALEEKR